MTPERAKELVEKGKKWNPIRDVICFVLAVYFTIFLIFKWIPAIVG